MTGYVLDSAAADILRDLYMSYLDGTSLPALAERLHVAGVPTVRGGRWVTTTVRDMLDNGFGAGLVASQGDLLEGAHPPVVSRSEWTAYVRRRDESRKTPPGVARQCIQPQASGSADCVAATSWQPRPERRPGLYLALRTDAVVRSRGLPGSLDRS